MLQTNRLSDQITLIDFSDNIKKLNVVIADKIKIQLNEIIDNGCNNLIIDFSKIIFVDSSGFGALVTVYNHAKNAGSKLMLANIAAETMELVKITKLDQVFDIYSSVEEAKKSII